MTEDKNWLVRCSSPELHEWPLDRVALPSDTIGGVTILCAKCISEALTKVTDDEE